MKKQVKIINFKANNFGIFKALELDFEKFKNGVIALKGEAGSGKSTIQKGVKLSTQGRNVLDDSAQYGEEWETETQLVDGDRKIFIGASKKDGEAIKYKLYEKDSEGKKVMTPVIDGVKATPAKYMDVISTELTFGIKDFLSESNTVHKKFMFSLFRPELEKLGVEEILKDLSEFTSKRDNLRTMCTHKGAFMADFERDGWKKEALEALQLKSVDELEQCRNNLLIEQGKSEGDGNAEFQKARGEKVAEGQKVVEEIRRKKEELENTYAIELGKYEKDVAYNTSIAGQNDSIEELLQQAEFIDDVIFDNVINIIEVAYKNALKTVKTPTKPQCPEIIDGKLKPGTQAKDYPLFKKLIDKYNKIALEYHGIKPENFTQSRDFETEIAEIDIKITEAKANNELIERYELNRLWVESSAKVDIKRGELAKLYAQVNTGVEGLRMKPFFDEESGKVDIKTIYTGNYSPEFFRNDTIKYIDEIKSITDGKTTFDSPEEKNERLKSLTGKIDERLLVSYSSTQRPIIGILLQIARLKKKAKALPYIFLDDVPMDKASLSLISKIAEENNLTVITSITGDFSKDKLTENEMLIEGGEIFFN